MTHAIVDITKDGREHIETRDCLDCALQAADKMWAAMSEDERDERSLFAVVRVRRNEDGEFDLDTAVLCEQYT